LEKKKKRRMSGQFQQSPKSMKQPDRRVAELSWGGGDNEIGRSIDPINQTNRIPTAIHPARFPTIPDRSELDRDLAKRERRRVRMSTETRRLTGVGHEIILPARLHLRCCSGEKEVDAGRERSQTDAARRGGERARRRFASPLTDGARGQLRGRSRVVRRRERSGWWWRREAEDERKRRAAQI
jgi:hypothetical protein